MTDKKLDKNLLLKDAQDGYDARLNYIRPVDAATLIIVDSSYQKPKVLMGKRSAAHKFMPNKFVFPGGRVDIADTRLRVDDELRAPVMQRLRADTRTRMRDSRLRAMALAAIRETYEETGLLIGRESHTPLTSKSPEWQSFFNHGITPSLKNIDFIGRAITPTFRPRRFDTRFFVAEISELYNDPQKLSGTGELLELHWLNFDEAIKKDLPSITHYVLLELQKRLQHPMPERYKKPAFFYRTLHGKPAMSELR